MALIELEQIEKRYRLGDMDVPVLRGVTLRIEKGEFVALVGTSGSGKSTLMNILGCLDTATSGRYLLDGQSVNDLNSDQRAELRNSKIGFVFQSFQLLPRTTALQNVAMPLAYRNPPMSDAQEKEKAKNLLSLVGLSERLDHFPSQLSGGQQQRVAIARSLVNDPQILFADEPTGNLDSKTTQDILGMLQALNEEQGLTVILVTHDNEVAKNAKRVIRISDGQIVEGL